jgi:hypothetical protein
MNRPDNLVVAAPHPGVGLVAALAHQRQQITTLDELPHKRGAGIPQASVEQPLCALAQLARHKGGRSESNPGRIRVKLVMDKQP